MNLSLTRKSAARLRAVQYLYQFLLHGKKKSAAELLQMEELEEEENIDGNEQLPVEPDKKLLRGIVQGATSEIEVLEKRLAAAIPAYWPDEKLTTLFRSILIAAAYELIYHPELATNIILNEYVGVTADFCDEQETALLNGLLQEMANQLRPAAASHG